MSHPKYMRIKGSRNPEDYYIWTPYLATNGDLEEYDGALPPKLPKKDQTVNEVPVAPPPAVVSALEQLQEIVGEAAEQPETGIDRIAAIRAAIPSLKPVEDWSKPASWNGFVSMPKVGPVSDAVGFKVNQDEIKEAMKQEA